MSTPLNRAKIVDRFRTCRDLATPIAARARALARLIEQFVSGDQWGRWDFTARKVSGDAWFDGVPRIHVNECQGLMTTWSALLNKDRRSAVATPASEQPEDVYRAEVTNRFIDFFVHENETASKTHAAVQNAFQAGTAGLKVWFDAERDAVRWSTLTVHTFLIDPVEDWRDAKWVIFENYYDGDEVAALWKAAGIKQEPPGEEAYTNAAGDSVRGVLGYELWQRPTREWPQGFYACIVNDQVVERKAYPYVVQDDSGKPQYLLPLSLMKVRGVRDTVYGKTPMTDVIPLQRALNEMVARTLKLARTVTNPQLVAPQEVLDGLDITETNTIGFNRAQAAGARSIGWTSPGEVSGSLFALRDYFEAKMNTVVGLNDLTVGTQNRSLSGRAIEAIYELDQQKNADASKSLDDMVLAAWRLTLALVQLFYTDVRKAEIADSDVATIVSFSGADIQGKNIRLESASEVDKRSDVRVGAAAEKVKGGLARAVDVEQAQRTPGFAAAKRAAQRLVDSYLRGEDVDVNANDYDMDVLGDALDRAKSTAMLAGKRADYVDLVKLQRFIRDELAEEVDQPGAEQLEPQAAT